MSIELKLEKDLYPLEAAMSAAYVFIDRCYVFLDRTADARVRVVLTPKPGVDEAALQACAGEFQNELLAQALRLRIAARHEKVREAIVARALFGAAPVIEAPGAPAPVSLEQLGIDPSHVPGADDDYLADPLGIAVPWEEKFGGETKDGGDGSK